MDLTQAQLLEIMRQISEGIRQAREAGVEAGQPSFIIIDGKFYAFEVQSTDPN